MANSRPLNSPFGTDWRRPVRGPKTTGPRTKGDKDSAEQIPIPTLLNLSSLPSFPAEASPKM
eukprot:5405589-Pyramimonas_sp.AAC.1